MKKLSVVLALLATLGCMSSSPDSPTEPEPEPTPLATPTPAPTPAAFSCPLARMSDHGNCRSGSPAFDGEVLQAIETLIRTKPQLFDVNDRAGCDTCVRLVDGKGFERAMVEELGKMGLCAQCDEECGVKATNDWNDQFKLANSTGYLLRPEKHYKTTCYPAAF